MEFALSREHEMLRDMVREFAEEVIAPRTEAFYAAQTLPDDVIEKITAQGLFGLMTSRDYGGSDMGHLASMIVLEELGKVCPSVGWLVMSTLENTIVLGTYASSHLKEKYLHRLARGEIKFCYGITEPAGGSDLRAMATTAEKVGEEYVINGRKVFISWGHRADLCFVIAKTGEKYTVFLVEKDRPGFEVGHRENTMGLNAVPFSELIFHDCRVGAENILGSEGQGTRISLDLLTRMGRPAMAAFCLGIGEKALEIARKYSLERRLYGQPIADLQAIQTYLAEMDVEVEATRWLTYHMGWMLDNSDNRSQKNQATCRAKLFAQDMAARVCMKAMSILGGYGITHEYRLTRLLADAMMIVPAAGTTEIMKVILARELVSG
ncbi:acyl-CoA dehydrogenase family protein [Thermodesulfobacteriota bacterium]